MNTKFELGEYHGWFVLPGQNGFSIPITLSTPPLITESILIIAMGALTSIAVIELTKYSNKQANIKIRDDAGSNALNAYGKNDITDGDSQLQVAALADYKIELYDKRYSGLAAIVKNAMLSFIPALFALLLALLAFVNNEIVTSINELNFQNVVALFLLGAGIESVKSVFDRQ